ncbi:hypothetical protein PT277_01270 [Acetobacteraceae bacterium ESL0709]|nr:hypothetical protein [Acetobacteraceae bacterium ESL0697]MDF7677332.1 hypothetical protein [Acetobacteraceae bacterium ESL0709]
MSSPIDLGHEILASQGRILSHSVKRHGLRAVFAIIALVFLFFAAISFHGVLWGAFLTLCHMGPFYAALCVLAVDVFMALIFVLLALRSRHPSGAEEKEKAARDHKIQEFKRAVEVTALAKIAFGPLGRFAGGQLWRVVRSPFKKKAK